MTTGPEGSSDARMVTALVRLRQSLTEVALPLDLPGAPALRTAKDDVLSQLEDYVIPRMMTIDAPLLAVVGGSTGAGKSTLVNSLVGEKVTTPGLLRPTTRSPVLVHHPADAHWFGQDAALGFFHGASSLVLFGLAVGGLLGVSRLVGCRPLALVGGTV